jgi:folate-binding protein YgfZ
MRDDGNSVTLEELGMLHVQGPDAISFLQGQLSNDLARLTAHASLLAGYHNPQGRTIALMRILWLPGGEILAIFPRELVAPVAARLSKFVLRAKVKITDHSARWRAAGAVFPAGSASGLELPLPAHVNDQIAHGQSLVVRVAGTPARCLVVSPAEARPLVTEMPAGACNLWRRYDVAAGLPQVYAATTEQFVAQMLNLDALDAIAFDKGCYTGQEVIARAHYRGRVKRRLQRFRSRTPDSLVPGDERRLADGRTLKVVEAAQLDDGRCEFLAVAPLAAQPAATEAVAGEHPLIDAEPLALPYELTDQ